MVLRRQSSQPRFWFLYKSGVLRSHSLFKGLLILNFIRRAAAVCPPLPDGGSFRQARSRLCKKTNKGGLRSAPRAEPEPGSARLALYAKQQDKALY